MKKTFLFFLLTLNITITCWAQIDEKSIMPPSPEASTFAKYIDYPISLSTGLPEITIPLYTLKSRKLSVPISFSYHSGGIKVSDRALIVGAGWTLNAGGAVSRTVRDLPDEQAYGFNSMNYGYVGDDTDNDVYKLFCLGSKLTNAPYIQTAVKTDGEPDIFYYSFPGGGGKFLFRNPSDGGQPVTIPFTPVKITAWGSVPFKVTDQAGNIYIFGDEGLPVSTDSYVPKPTADRIINTWYLTKIISVDKTDTISFNYESFTGNPQTIVTHTGNEQIQMDYGQRYNPQITQNLSISHLEQTVRLKEILCTNGKAVFSYGGGSAYDARSLSSIDIYDNRNNEVRSFTIYQTQFDGCLRPRLDAIKEIGYINNSATNSKFHRFTYTTPDAPSTESLDQDFWGFYNGKGNTDMLCSKIVGTDFVSAPEKRMVDSVSLMKGMLKTIMYPTGGTTEFLFQPNQITYLKNVTSVINNDIVHTILNYDPIDPTMVTPITVTFTASSNTHGTLFLEGYPNPGYTASGSRPVVRFNDLTTGNNLVTTGVLTSSTIYTSTVDVPLVAGHSYQMLFAPNSYGTDVRTRATFTEIMPPGSSTFTGEEHINAGGLRIMQITLNDNNGGILRKKYNYTKPYFNSGFFNGDFDALTARYHEIKGATTSLGSPNLDDVFIRPNLETYVEGLSVPVGGVSNSSISYEEVEEVQTSENGTTLGKTVYTFNKAFDEIQNWFPTFKSDKEFIRTQLLDKKIYKIDGFGGLALIDETTSVYNNVNDQYGLDTKGTGSIKFYLAFSTYNWAQTLAGLTITQVYAANSSNNIYGSSIIPGFSTPCPDCPIFSYPMAPFVHISPSYYHIVYPLLSSTTSTRYDSNGLNPVTSQTTYAYDNLLHMQPTGITSVNSNQKAKVKSIKYPLDYLQPDGIIPPPLQAIFDMQDKNIVTPQIDVTTNVNNIQTEEVVTDYHSFPGTNGSITLPQKVNLQVTSHPIEQRIQFTYNTNGNLIEQSKIGGRITAYQWGYKGQFPVAQVTNTTANNIFYESFEEGNVDNLTSDSKTGHYSHLGTYTKSLSGLDPGDYKLSYWQKTGTSWSYIILPVTVTGNNYSINLTGQIDDVRFYPFKSQMTSCTFDPLVGMTSSTDPKGEIIYYEYDGFQQLATVRDQDGNILQHIEYHYAAQ